MLIPIINYWNKDLLITRFRDVAHIAFIIVLLVTIVAVFVPFLPGVPHSGLDASWVYGMNQVVAQRLSFGQEVMFTFGPLPSIYTKEYHPSTDFMMVSGSSYLALSYWVCFIFLMKRVQWVWTLNLCVILAGLMYSRDSLLFSLPLIIGLFTLKIHSFGEQWLRSKIAAFCVALVFSSLGLLPLVKGSILPLTSVIAVSCSIFFISSKHRVLAAISLISPIVSIIFFWIASGQSVINLGGYFTNMLPLISGYTEAMAASGNIYEIVLYCISSSVLIGVLAFQKSLAIATRLFLCGIYGAFLFISFKAGFVRHDAHALASSTSLLIATFLLPFVINSSSKNIVIVCTLLTWFYIDNDYRNTSTKIFTSAIQSTYTSAWSGLKKRVTIDNWPRVEFDLAVKAIRSRINIPVMQGTTDIYSYGQSLLIASGNTWSPRPVFQSYSVYTSELAEANRKYLMSIRAPDNILFKVEPIDGRLPSIEDGASWPILMSHYRPEKFENDFLLLRKRDDINSLKVGVTNQEITKHVFGESVYLPSSKQPLFAKIEIRPTTLGKLLNTLFKPSPLQITLELQNGTKRQFRIVSGMIDAGFIISPLIENTSEFGMLYANNSFLNDKQVKSISISSHGGTSSEVFWENNYTMTLSQINISEPKDLKEIYSLDRIDENLSNLSITEAKQCAGAIDMINNTSSLPAQQILISDLLQVSGWLVNSINEGSLPDASYVILSNSQNKRHVIKTRMVHRLGLGEHFKKPEFDNAGYMIMADVSTLENGQYTLDLAIRRGDKIEICPQFKTLVMLAK